MREFTRVDPEDEVMALIFDAVMDDLRALGATVVSVPHLDELVFEQFDGFFVLVSEFAKRERLRKVLEQVMAEAGLDALAYPTIGRQASLLGTPQEGMLAEIELFGRAWGDAALLGYAFDYDQATRHRHPQPRSFSRGRSDRSWGCYGVLLSSVGSSAAMPAKLTLMGAARKVPIILEMARQGESLPRWRFTGRSHQSRP